MINFNFDMDEQDAENLCSMINDSIVNTIAHSLDYVNDKPRMKWFKSHIKYLKQLQAKVEASMKKVNS